MLYAITDIESTGGAKGKDKITEIAIYLFDGKAIIDEFHTLINPQRRIEPFVVKLTGITDQMVKDAPTFDQVAERIFEITKDAVFVAHNVSFDYPFLKREFRAIGKDFDQNRLCTINLSRKIIPNHKSYSLGKLTDELGISLNGRHRADGDALATVELFKILLKNDTDGLITPKPNSKLNISIEILSMLPMLTGVYYFYNSSKELIYIGRSKNIHDRVFAHLGDTKDERTIEMASAIADVKYTVTGSDLIAQLHEIYEINIHQPYYNTSTVIKKPKFGIFPRLTTDGYYEITVSRNNKETPLMGFSTDAQAKKFLTKKINEYNLCNCLTGISSRGRSCLHHQLNLCKGAGVKEETKAIYNDKFVKMVASVSYETPNAIILCKGKNETEQGIILIENGIFKGFGFIKDKSTNTKEDYINCITTYYETPEIRKLLQMHIKKGKHLTIVPF